MDLLKYLQQNDEKHDDLRDWLSEKNDVPFTVEEITSMQNSVISMVNAEINQACTRQAGLRMLIPLLKCLPKETLHQYTILWITKAIQVLESIHSNKQDLNQACEVVGHLIISAKDLAELHKQVSMQIVKQLVNIIGNLETERLSEGILHLISTLLHHYPEPCEKLQVPIKKVILPLLDSKNEKLVEMGAISFAFLVKATERCFKAPSDLPNYTCCVYNELLLCNSLHSILDEFFVDLSEAGNDNLQCLDLPSLPKNDVWEYYNNLEQRFRNICVFLSTVLSNGFSKSAVNENNVFQILCRGLSKTPQNFQNEDSVKKQMMSLILPRTHVSLLLVLESLIAGFRQELLPSSVTILQLINQTLVWTEKIAETRISMSGCKPYKTVRISAYKTLSVWLKFSGATSAVELFADDLLPHILKDIMFEKERVVLATQNTQSMSKKALKKFRNSQYENNESLGTAQKNNSKRCLNADLCVEALIALQGIFRKGNCWLDASFYKKVQNVIVRVLDDLYVGTSEQNVYQLDSVCRLELLKVLRALLINPHPRAPCPTAFAIRTCILARNDSSIDVAEEAELTISALEKIVHPAAPSLLPSIEIEESQKRKPEILSDSLLPPQKQHKAIPLFEITENGTNGEILLC